MSLCHFPLQSHDVGELMGWMCCIFQNGASMGGKWAGPAFSRPAALQAKFIIAMVQKKLII